MREIATQPRLNNNRTSVDKRIVVRDWWAVLWAGHFALGIILSQIGPLTTAHAAISLALAAFVAFRESSRQSVLNAMMYVAGSEVLWRMGSNSVPWETGKYALLGMILITIWRERDRHIPVKALLFLVFLVPGIAATWTLLDAGLARQIIVATLLGPILLSFMVWYSRRLTLDRAQWRDALIWLIAPVITTGAFVLIRVLGVDIAFWTTESNFAMSGGFGPNQVSMTLGLGSVALMLLALTVPAKAIARSIYILFALWLLTQAILTFSRTGVIFGIMSIIVLLVFMMRRSLVTVLFASSLSLTVALYVLPLLFDFTQSALLIRYTDLNWSNRDRIAQQEIQLFIDTFPYGTGIGLGSFNRQSLTGDDRIASHTEYTRLLAEHGILGVLLNLLLVWMTVTAFLSAKGSVNKAVVATLLTWSLLMMLGNGTRVAAITFMFGLASAQFMLDPQSSVDESEPIHEVKTAAHRR